MNKLMPMSRPMSRRRFGQQPGVDPFQGYRDLSPDLWPRRVRYRAEEGVMDRSTPPEYLGPSIFVGKGLLGRVVTILTTPVLIVRSEYAWPYIILNPFNPLSSGDSLLSQTIKASGTETASGNTQSTPIVVRNYRNVHFHLDVTAVTGTWDFYAQTLDLVSNNWADSQRIFSAITGTGTYYANVGTFGIVDQIAVRWDEVAAGSITFSLSAQLKDNIVSGASSGVDRTIYIGPNDSISTVSAYPILEGGEKMLVVGENVEIWGVAGTTVDIRVFEV